MPTLSPGDIVNRPYWRKSLIIHMWRTPLRVFVRIYNNRLFTNTARPYSASGDGWSINSNMVNMLFQRHLTHSDMVPLIIE